MPKNKINTKVKPQVDDSMSGLNQSFRSKDNVTINLKTFLNANDWWELKSKTHLAYILSHDAIKKIADKAGIDTNPTYNIKLEPSVSNNYQLIVECIVCDAHGRLTKEWGEVQRGTLGVRGRMNPANMAQKRAFDRAVLRHLGITGLLGEDELLDEEPEKEMDKLTHEEKKIIAPLINEIWQCTEKSALTIFQKKMAKEKSKLNEGQLDVLRGLFKKKLAEIQKSF